MISRFVNFLRVARRLGLGFVFSDLRARALGRPVFEAPLPGSSGCVQLRCRSSDAAVYAKVIAEREYGVLLSDPPRIIVDAGANVGLSAVFFALQFPGARVFALEPEPGNFEMLCANTRSFPSIQPLRAALWDRDGTLSIQDPGLGAWGYRVSPGSGSSSVRALSVDSLMREFGLDRIDLLKIDIEGAERDVFSDPGAWIDDVGTIVAELHDRYVPGSSRAFFRATESFDWEWHRGENVFVTRERFVGPQVPRDALRISTARPDHSRQGSARGQ